VLAVSVMMQEERADASPLIRIVRSGECLSEIAQECDVTVEQIQRWNHLDGDVIHVGQRLIVGQRGSSSRSEPRGRRPSKARAAGHTIKAGDTLSAIALRYGVDVDDLMSWNEGLRANHLAVGSRLTIYSRRAPPSESVGRSYNGKLVNGRRLEPHKMFVIRDLSKAWGTQETVRWIHEAFDEVQRSHPRAQRVRIHDLSLHQGGPIPDHRSHRSGRDVDGTYFQRRCPRSGCELRNVAPGQLDVAPQWTLFRHWIRSGQAQVIFMDYDLQAPLYRYVQRRGATPSQLNAWFQYPRGRRASGGIIRHFSNHRNHYHVRFVCPRGDDECLY
jgi:LysM repeat protein